jgi:hypothetical protein
VLRNYLSARISKEEKELFRLIEKVNRDPASVRRSDVERARKAGWSDEALYDATTVCALFRFYNTWVDAMGVHDMPAQAYRMSGKRLATEGYAPGSPPSDSASHLAPQQHESLAE